jgi:dimeric dUTPase (all-alpha-NTP-PPase superfamily)
MSKMSLSKLFEMQSALDRYIEENHQLQNENLFDRKVLALLVEIGELANETRSFKFWSVKPSSEKKVILEEFVDGIHFILSLGLECDFQNQELQMEKEASTKDINEQFLKIYQAVSIFQGTKNVSDYQHVFETYLQLGTLLGIDYEEMEQAYIEKNEVNYKRQNQNY